MKGKYIGFSFGLTGQQTLYIRTLFFCLFAKKDDWRVANVSRKEGAYKNWMMTHF